MLFDGEDGEEVVEKEEEADMIEEVEKDDGFGEGIGKDVMEGELFPFGVEEVGDGEGG